jgi:thiosulfate/3-mercaptopyruvate sulfurtransferase
MAAAPLISPAGLAARLDDPAWAIVDCRFDLADPAWGEAEYLAGHIPGAVYAHLDRDLSAPKTGTNGRHPLPDPAHLAAALGQWGIDASVHVVAYDQSGTFYGPRLWWLLRWLGHDRVSVLDGGLARWTAEGRPLRAGAERRDPRLFNAHPRRELWLSAEQVEQVRQDPAWRVLDARAPARFRGEVEPIDPVAGHIPGAANFFIQEALEPDGTMRAPDDLRARLEARLGGTPPERVVAYCGSGVAAAQTVLALEVAGLPGAKLYPGSWSEWVSDPARPVARD